MPPKEEPKPTPDPDEEFFKEHGVENDDDKTFLKTSYLREKYLAHRRELDDKAKKPSKKKSMFARD